MAGTKSGHCRILEPLQPWSAEKPVIHIRGVVVPKRTTSDLEPAWGTCSPATWSADISTAAQRSSSPCTCTSCPAPWFTKSACERGVGQASPLLQIPRRMRADVPKQDTLDCSSNQAFLDPNDVPLKCAGTSQRVQGGPNFGVHSRRKRVATNQLKPRVLLSHKSLEGLLRIVTLPARIQSRVS